MQMILKNIHWFIIVIAIVVLGAFAMLKFTSGLIGQIKSGGDIKNQLTEKKNRLELLKTELETQKTSKVESGKTIFHAEDIGFSAEASFAPLFEIFVDYAQNAGIKIRSIEYNYAPANDTIFTANLTGYNVCELSITAVGTYADFQNFFKSIAKENFLMSFPEMDLAPWDNDRSILVNKFKLRLYTKTS